MFFLSYCFSLSAFLFFSLFFPVMFSYIFLFFFASNASVLKSSCIIIHNPSSLSNSFFATYSPLQSRWWTSGTWTGGVGSRGGWMGGCTWPYKARKCDWFWGIWGSLESNFETIRQKAWSTDCGSKTLHTWVSSTYYTRHLYLWLWARLCLR